MFGSRHGVECVMRFFGNDHVLFGTDAPFDTKAGSHFIPATISDVEELVADEAGRVMVFEGNVRRILRLTLSDGGRSGTQDENSG